MSSPVMFDLCGKVALVTGGNGGLGQAIAQGLGEAGATIAIVGRNEVKNARSVQELESLGVHAVAVTLDLTKREDILPALKTIEQQVGVVDILVNNAGNISMSGGVVNESLEDWDSVIATHLNAAFLLSKYVAEEMLHRSGGKIINVGSLYASFGSGHAPSYSAAKGAVVQLTKSMAIELAAANIQVNAIIPGWFETEMTAPVKSLPFNEEILLRTPARRWGRPDELAGAAVFLASRASDFVTGTTLVVDGGYSIR